MCQACCNLYAPKDPRLTGVTPNCRCFNPDACPGGIYEARHLDTAQHDLNTNLCAPGYTGNLCAVCAPEYGTVKAFTCKPCMKPAATIALYASAALVMLVAVSTCRC
jgi:hypothetical protein